MLTMRFDPWDFLGVLGMLFFVAGVAVIYWPAAMIITGLAALIVYFLREIQLVPSPPAPEPDASSN